MPWTHRGHRLGSGCMSQVTTWGMGWGCVAEGGGLRQSTGSWWQPPPDVQAAGGEAALAPWPHRLCLCVGGWWRLPRPK